MTSSTVPGTEGYGDDVEAFVEGSQALRFEEVCARFVPFVPTSPCNVLDVGAGAGQNAAALAALGHRVVAVEPLSGFLEAATRTYAASGITWCLGSLPGLECLDSVPAESFGFILVEAMWHHLHPNERRPAMARIARLLGAQGRLAISLRNGPAGRGTRVFPTAVDETLAHAAQCGLIPLDVVDGLPSFFHHKPHVRWARLVLGHDG